MKHTNKSVEAPSAFLWVLRALTSAFLLGYLVSVYMAMVIAGWFPSGNRSEDLLAIGLLLLFVTGYYLMWIRRELLTAIIFLVWFTSLWLLDIFIGGDRWEDAPVPGTLVFILAALFMVYHLGRKRHKKSHDR
jgi:hypothetical protein